MMAIPRLRGRYALASLGMTVLLGAIACQRAPRETPLFELLSPRSTGVTFVNELPEKPDFNILNYLYYYNGGGVAAGDIDGDGLPDLYFTSNLGSNRLYLNKGNYRFEDITERAGVAASRRVEDRRHDGRRERRRPHWTSTSPPSATSTMNGHNVLYINNGDGTFTDRTKEFGLEHAGYSTQAVFFDYDGDGDLDMYLLNHSTHTERRIGERAELATPNVPATACAGTTVSSGNDRSVTSSMSAPRPASTSDTASRATGSAWSRAT